MSSTQLTIMGKNRSSKGGKRDDLGFYVRSGWEANWARYQKWLQQQNQILKWEYEPQTFEFTTIKRGSRFYTPDFRITNVDGSIEYHEIKGYLDAVSNTKLHRMALYYPDVKLILIDSKQYYAIARKVKGLIPHWE